MQLLTWCEVHLDLEPESSDRLDVRQYREDSEILRSRVLEPYCTADKMYTGTCYFPFRNSLKPCIRKRTCSEYIM